MSSFINGLTTNDARTENNMPAHSFSGSACLDLFFNLGTRNLGEAEEVRLFTLAWREDPGTALKILFYNRDVRGGRGERGSFRRLMRLLWTLDREAAKFVTPLIPEYGRWDDLHILLGGPGEEAMFSTIINGLDKENGLAAKWTPRKGELAAKLRSRMSLTPKAYRKLLVGLTKVVETQMCAKQWEAINFSQVPSRASMIYSKAFSRHGKERYAAWREELKKPKEERDPKVKINVGVLYPHEIVHKLTTDAEYPCEEAWKALGEMFPTTDEKIIAVCDVSGSMYGLPLEVSVALGIFLSERLTGPFRDMFITFSANPRLQRLGGSLHDKYQQLARAQWDMNTNLEAVFQLIAGAAQTAAPEDVPTHVLILSDMQFDEAVNSPSDNAMQMIDRLFAKRSLKRPAIVFWNLRAVDQTIPVKMHQSGAALVSGFSPSVLKTLINQPGDFTPLGIMRSTLADPRYDALNLQPSRVTAVSGRAAL